MKKEIVKTKILQIMKKIIDREIKKNSNALLISNCGSFFHQPKRPVKDNNSAGHGEKEYKAI